MEITETLKEFKSSLLNVDYCKVNNSWNFDNIISPFTRIYYVTSGHAKIIHGGETYSLSPGHMYLIPSFSHLQCKCDDFMEVYYIHFFEEVSSGISIFNFHDFTFETHANESDVFFFQRLLAICTDRSLKNANPDVYDNLPTLKEFEKLNTQLKPNDFLEVKGMISILMSRFIKSNQTGGSQKLSGFFKIAQYINQNISKPLTINELSEQFNTSPDHFSRIFQENLGIRPSKYIENKRIERAQLYLTTTSLPLKEISFKVGFSTTSYFSKVFKKATNMTPLQYRNKN